MYVMTEGKTNERASRECACIAVEEREVAARGQK